jgi:DNA-binding SARP family transcriptional activator
VKLTFAAFGETAVVLDGVRVPITRGRERGVLCALLAAHGEHVPAERLALEVWGAEASDRVLASVQVAVSRLRRLLEPGRRPGDRSPLVSTAAGYAIAAEVEDVDTWAFEAAATRALGLDGAAALEQAEAALAGWAGTPYATVDGETVRAASDRLHELRLALQEQRIRALLHLDRAQDALRAAADVAPLHPYAERLWALLALAQYRCARQADALATLRRLRERLADELGVDPSHEVRSLEQQVLQQDPALLATAPGGRSPQSPADPPVPDPVPDPARNPAADRGRGPSTVGRHDTTSAAAAAVRVAAATGRAHFLLVAGEPGIGKSRLVQDVSCLARDDGWRVLVGRCHEGDYAPALWPWLGMVRELAADEPEVDPRLAPLLVDAPREEDSGAGAGLRMFDAVVDLLSRSASQQPLLCVLEDLHWADSTSLQLLRHLADTAPAVPLAVVVTRRTTEAVTADLLVDTMATLARAGAERLRVDGLDRRGVGELLATTIGSAAAGERLVQHVSSVTGGNPFFVLQYARLLAGLPDLASVEPAALPVPDSITDVLRQRIERLSTDGIALLTAAAVVNRTIDPALVAELSGLDLDASLDLLDAAVASGLAEETSSGYAFVHALAREALRSRMSPARRMLLHDRAARVLEGRGAEDADATMDVAHHAHLAAPLGPEQAARAVDWLSRAAAVATARSAHQEALELWSQVLTHAPPRSPEAAAAQRGRAAALLRLARTPEARAAVEEAVGTARDLGRWDLVAEAAAILGGAGVWSWREHGKVDHDFIAVLTDAVDHLEPMARARVLATLQMEHYYGARGDVVQDYGEASVRLAREIGDARLLDEMLMVRMVGMMGSGDRIGRLALVEELVARRPHGEIEVAALFYLGLLRYENLEVDAADEAMSRCAAAAGDLRHSGVDIPLAWWAWARAKDREAPDADEIGDRALELHRRAGFIAARELECLHALHSRPRGVPVPGQTIALAVGGSAALRAAVAWALVEDGDLEGARAALGPPAPDGEMTYSSVVGRCLRVGVLARLGDVEGVRGLLHLLEPHLGVPAIYGSIYHYGVVDHFYALALEAVGHGGAAACATRAAELNERLQCRPWARRSRELAARLVVGKPE